LTKTCINKTKLFAKKKKFAKVSAKMLVTFCMLFLQKSKQLFAKFVAKIQKQTLFVSTLFHA
jgi:hypothetical protein